MAIVDNAFREWIADFKATNPGVADARAIIDTAQYAFAAGRKAQRETDAARQPVDPDRGHIDPSWSLHDRVEFALRDAGFDLDEAAFVAEAADRARQPVESR